MELGILTDKKWLGLDKNRLAFSVFVGDENAPFDQEAFDLWKKLGVPEYRIARLPKKNNWWGRPVIRGRAGRTRKCFIGPATRIKFRKVSTMTMIYGWKSGTMCLCNTTKAKMANIIHWKQKNIDTGMGLEKNGDGNAG